jgi:hydroxymethylbilane synthase
MKLRISARQSALAQIQAFQVGEALLKKISDLQVEYQFRESLGDRNLTDPLWKMPEKGVFTQDFVEDLVKHKTDLVVHSWKDLPTEGPENTQIAATLPRADQRDLLLFKKSSEGKKDICIFSSSPRRAHNLKNFFLWALPWKTDSADFRNVRGNVQTRVRKLLETPDVDGLIVAKAAMDRLLPSTIFPEVASFLRSGLSQLNWMILPLSVNPNAAAQGALAVEIAKDRSDVLEMIRSIQCEETFLTVQQERNILKSFGGGCHLALGMSVLQRPYGRIEIVQGMTPDQKTVTERKLYPRKTLPNAVKAHRIELEVQRKSLSYDLKNIQAVKIAKAENIQTEQLKNKLVWSAGLMTWEKLAAMGVWVHGSQESLGENEDPGTEFLAPGTEWYRLTHDKAEIDREHSINSYQIDYMLKAKPDLNQPAYFWKSGSEFLFVLQQFPELKKSMHVCGPGRTYQTIKEYLGSDQNLYVELNDEFITVI